MAVRKKKSSAPKRTVKKSSHEVYDTLKQAAKHLGFDVSFLKKLKQSKVPGFRGSRVYWDEAKEYLDENPDVLEALQSEDENTKEYWDIEKAKEYVYEKRIKNGILRGDLIQKGLVESFNIKIAEDLKQAQQRARPSIATKVQGLSGPEIIAILQKHDRKLLEIIARPVDIPKSQLAQFDLD